VARCLGWGRDGQMRAGVGCPRGLGSTGEERWWWSGVAAEGAGKEVEGGPNRRCGARGGVGEFGGGLGWHFAVAQ
jgi:hypothetical protein